MTENTFKNKYLSVIKTTVIYKFKQNETSDVLLLHTSLIYIIK